MATIQDITFKIFSLNSVYGFTMPVKETKGGPANDVRVDFQITDGEGVDISDKITILEVSIPVGLFTSPTWFLGDFVGNEDYGGAFSFRVDDPDITYVKLTATISTSSTGESNTGNNVRIFPFEGISHNTLLEGGVVLINPDAKYDDDSAALAAGLNMYEYYALSATNTYSLPEGIIKQIVDVSPAYVPSYVPVYVPGYTPNYAPNYTPGYTPNYTPGYSPSLYAPTYAPSYVTPSYVTPTYTPTYAPT